MARNMPALLKIYKKITKMKNMTLFDKYIETVIMFEINVLILLCYNSIKTPPSPNNF